MYNEIKEEGYNEMMNTRWGIILKYLMLLGGVIFGGSFGIIIAWSFPVSFPILGFAIWDDYERKRKNSMREMLEKEEIKDSKT